MRTRPRILVVDDEPSIVTFLSIGLRSEGYDVVEARDGRQALERFHEFDPDLVVLDRMLPDLDGAEVCARIRNVSRVPVLMLTARNEVDDRVTGLEQGADDYVGKPIRLHELAARVRALLRRNSGDLVQVGDITLDRRGRTVRRGDREATLTPRECTVLHTLMERPGEVLTRHQLLQGLWGIGFDGETNILEVHVSALRTKLGDTRRRIIRSVRGVGYALRLDDHD